MSILAKVRSDLMKSGLSEAEVLANSGGIQGMFQELQDLKREMNEAKKKAADEAAKPYLEALEALEKRYSIFVKLSARDSRK